MKKETQAEQKIRRAERNRIVRELKRVLTMWEAIDLSTREGKVPRTMQLKDLIKEL